ncbi:hypothetical protein I2I05_02435 [Hymenobacter sp. BT683]|uniref:Uncharacterized protein n=1 Tax=Hymenobacter jeongseonensis TaxID=2791027 RepID=A0ABS0IE37_9BACT|nr:hypothetical protein [Hymenobacter jeongseonensis]MBF9236243.1 hypothetical protein [Hymenobacter jeongseonensis]
MGSSTLIWIKNVPLPYALMNCKRLDAALFVEAPLRNFWVNAAEYDYRRYSQTESKIDPILEYGLF